MTQEYFEKIKAEIENADMTEEARTMLRNTVEESKAGMTLEQYQGLIEAIDKAGESNRPFAVVSDDTLAVVGDANDTKINAFDYEIKFTKPVYEDDNLVGQRTETKIYKNVWVTPRKNARVVKMLALLMPYFRKVSEDGKVTEYTIFELGEILASMEDNIYELMYELVAYVLDIPAEEKDCMELASVVKTVLKLIFGSPEQVNEADAFFGSSSENPQGE